MPRTRVTLTTAFVIFAVWMGGPASGQSPAAPVTLGVFLQLGFAFPFADYVDGQWREARQPGSPGSWVFHPLQSADSRTVESDVPVSTSFCGNLVGPLMPVRQPRAAAGPASSTDVHASFGLLLRGQAHVVPLRERGATDTPSGQFTRVDAWLRRQPELAMVPAGSRHVMKAWMTPDASQDSAVARAEVDVFPPGGQVRLLRLEAWLVLSASGEVHVVERSLEPDAGDGIKSSTTVRPLGVVTVDDRVFIVTDEHGWEHVDYVIRERSDHTLIERLRVQGPCAG